ncbi:P-loop containing nucleoside triphosphate hydrolase protein [Kalaharituber pfeilii]|nr:P-loop containing nucleoside triphosphate hydrolase protein [Kalaharituber pfeilii]
MPFTDQPNSSPVNPLDSREKSHLFDIIDKFRELGIQEDIPLPQLVVVGDQSSGKSSLLEGLTGLPFPVAGTICTRFATQIVFRRTAPDEGERIRISIIPSKNCTEEQKEALREFSQDVETLDADEFQGLIEKASSAMGLPKPGELREMKSGPRFSDDVLKIELSGPNHTHFSVVDVPGIFQAATVLQSEDDIEMIETLVKGYIGDSRTIILAVASSLHETANQKVFRLAKDADPSGSRTLGVLTKPDAVQRGDEQRVIDVARNNVTKLHHGWFVVRNRSTQDIADGVTLEQRNANEAAFFSQPPWKALPADRVGIRALEKFLKALLNDHVRREFPTLLREMDGLITKAERELEKMGPPRETPDEQRQILTHLAGEFYKLANNAILGHYRDDFFTTTNKESKRRLRMRVVASNEKFAENVMLQGCQREFDNIMDKDQCDVSTEELIKNPDSIYYVIKQIHSESRGMELPGMVNPIVVQNIFHWQSMSWDALAKEYLQEVKTVVDSFVDTLLKYVCADEELESRIHMRLEQRVKKGYVDAEEELKNILKSERDGVLLTLDEGYVVELQKARNQRNLLALKKVDLSVSNESGKDKFEVLESILSAVSPSNEVQTVNDIHDILKAFYYIAQKRFVDTVVAQVVERHFLAKEDAPAKCFSPEWVASLGVQELQGIAGEDRDVSARRAELLEKLEKWKAARKVAAGW